MNGSGARKRISVIYLWWIIQLAFRSSSADCLVTTTNAATTSNPYRRYRYGNTQQPISPPESRLSSSSNLRMVAWIPPRGGSMTPPASAASASVTALASDEPSRWTKIRRTIFPIHGEHEVTKFLLIGSINFFIILALTLTRDTKDTLIVTQCGAEAIAFLKVCDSLNPFNASYLFHMAPC